MTISQGDSSRTTNRTKPGRRGHRQDLPSPRRCAALALTVGAHLCVTSTGALPLVSPHQCRCCAAPREAQNGPAPTPVCRRQAPLATEKQTMRRDRWTVKRRKMENGENWVSYLAQPSGRGLGDEGRHGLLPKYCKVEHPTATGRH
jgi:hypothetical protein